MSGPARGGARPPAGEGALAVRHLHAVPYHRREVAELLHRSFWSDAHPYAVDALEQLLEDACDPDRVPLALVATEGGRLRGTVGLVERDDPLRPRLGPWLAALAVTEEARGRGIGRLLVRALLDEARRLGVARLYLRTSAPGLFTPFGAALHEDDDGGESVLRIDP